MEKWNKNKGYSLVELIVIMAILAIVSVGGIVGVSTISSKPAQQAASKLKTVIQNDRTSALGKYKTELFVVGEGGGVKVTENFYTDGSTLASSKDTRICDEKVRVQVSDDNATWNDVVDGYSLTVNFDRSSGAIKIPDHGDVYFKFTKSGKSYTVRIYHLTGKVELQ